MKLSLYCWLLILLLFPIISMAQIHTNQAMIESLSPYSDLDDTDIDSVLLTVLKHTSDELIVYPSEGYYYFWFYHQGNLIRGNLRFSHDLVDKGQVSFAYYYDIEGKGRQVSETHHKIYSVKDQLLLTKVTSQKYKLSYKNHNKTVILKTPTSDYKPIAEEVFLGDMQDESGVVFTFIFNKKTQQFYYLLDKTQTYEYYYSLSPHISVGARTGFVYFHDNSAARQPRKILVGVSQQSSARNSFYDGPFDQLPDHYLGSTKFKDYLGLAYPYLQGKVDNHGHFLDDSSNRVAVTNYVAYEDLEIFKYLEQCHTQSIACVQNFITLVNKY